MNSLVQQILLEVGSLMRSILNRLESTGLSMIHPHMNHARGFIDSNLLGETIGSVFGVVGSIAGGAVDGTVGTVAGSLVSDTLGIFTGGLLDGAFGGFSGATVGGTTGALTGELIGAAGSISGILTNSLPGNLVEGHRWQRHCIPSLKNMSYRERKLSKASYF